MIIFATVIQAISALLIVLLTFFLVKITKQYAEATNDMVEEMQKARHLQLEPYVRGYLKPVSSVGFDIRVINTGLGAAEDLKFTFYVDDKKLEQNQYLNLLVSGRYQDYALIKNKETKEHLFYIKDYEAFENLTIEFEYRNVLGKVTAYTQVIKIKEELSLSNEGIRYAREETIDKIENHLKSITKELKEIGRK